MKTLSSLMYLVVLFTFSSKLYSWENKFTHPAITNNSIAASVADNYLKTQLGLSGGLSTQLYWDFPSDIEERMTENNKVEPTTTKTVLNWLKAGSSIEDEDGKFKPWRPRHHFYDPTRNAGLDNHTAHPEWNGPGTSSWLPLGTSALDWAIDGHSSYEPYNNHDKWATARNLFYDALTAQSQSGREAYLAESLLKLGCVLHLLEDMGVPAHTRNDFLYGHYRSVYKWDWGNDLEKDVETKVIENGGNSLWSGSSAVAFDKLTKYFDTDTRVSDDYLGSSVLPPDTWGLSEATNYQFWSLSTISGSYLQKYYFPHPHKAYMGTPITEGTVHKKIYFNGTNYGVSHIARESYTYYYTVTGPNLTPETMELVESTNTTDDNEVTDDYADITIPRTINYATGLANYFFRGKLSVILDYNTCEEIKLNIANESENSGINQYLKGGVFELYWEDPDGDRTEVTGLTVFDSDNPWDDDEWSSSCSLAYGSSIRAEFPKPEGAVEKFVLVYKGNICGDINELDSDDSEALAAAIIENPGCPFASNDCGCFLDPCTPIWNSGTTYSEEDLAEHSGYTYQSNAGNNTNHNPYNNPVWWTKVSNTVSSGCEDWDSTSPYGGIGKTPKYISVTFSGINTPVCDPEWGPDPRTTVNRTFVLTGGGSCGWSCFEEGVTINGCQHSWYCWLTLSNGRVYLELDTNCKGEESCWDCIIFQNEVDTLTVACGGGLDGLVISNEITGEACRVKPDDYKGGGQATIILGGSVVPELWVSLHDYEVGDEVIGSDNKTYICAIAHTSALTDKPINGANWETYWGLAEGCCGE